MLAVVIREGRATREDIPQTFAALQEVVQGYVEPFFTEPSPFGNGSLTGYVNEEGLVIGLPVAFGVYHSREYVSPLAGNAVIVGLSDDGETRGLTDAEAERVLQSYRPAPFGVCPAISGPEPEMVPIVPVRGILHIPALTA